MALLLDFYFDSNAVKCKCTKEYFGGTRCSQINNKCTTSNAPGQRVTVGQCCFEADRVERSYERSLHRGQTKISLIDTIFW